MIILAGTPPTTTFSGTFFVTTEPAAMIEPFSIVTPGTMVAFEPIQTFSPITIGAGCKVLRFFGGKSWFIRHWLATNCQGGVDRITKN